MPNSTRLALCLGPLFARALKNPELRAAAAPHAINLDRSLSHYGRESGWIIVISANFDVCCERFGPDTKNYFRCLQINKSLGKLQLTDELVASGLNCCRALLSSRNSILIERWWYAPAAVIAASGFNVNNCAGVFRTKGSSDDTDIVPVPDATNYKERITFSVIKI